MSDKCCKPGDKKKINGDCSGWFGSYPATNNHCKPAAVKPASQDKDKDKAAKAGSAPSKGK